MPATPEESFLDLVQRSDTDTFTEAELEAVYNKLGPVKSQIVIGEWKGGSFDTGHPADAQLRDMNWVGKTFHSTELVDPIIIEKDGQRVWDEKWGHARLRQVEFRGVLSTAMIYDDHAIIDHFRYVNDHLIAGAMDTSTFGNAGTYYFYLFK